MFEITEKQLYKLKYENASKYRGKSMASIFIEVCLNNEVTNGDFLELIKPFYHRYLGDYIDVKMPDSSFILILFDGEDLRIKSYGYEIEDFNYMFRSVS